MGLFDFVKSAGVKLFDKEEAEAPVITNTDAGKTKISEAMEKLISSMQLPISDLDVKYQDSVATISGSTESAAAAEKAVVALGNVQHVERVNNMISVTAPAAPEPRFYTVQSGDSLSKIAKEFYGDPMKYTQIFEANQPMLENPDKIYPGQVLRIPE